MAAELGRSQAYLSLLEANRVPGVGLQAVCEMASLLGLEASLAFHPAGIPLRDKGHEALIGRLTRLLSAEWKITREAPFPNPGDPRSWDLLLRRGHYLVGIEAETRIRDVQALVRRMRERARQGGADVIVIILSDSAHNRALVDQLRLALGDDFAASPRVLLRALRAGLPLRGSGVVVV